MKRRTYKLAKGWRIFTVVTLPLLMVLCGALLVIPFIDDWPFVWAFIISMASLALIAMMGLGMYDMLTSYWSVSDREIIAVRALNTRRVKTRSIKGFTINQNYLIFHTPKLKKKKLRVSNYVGDFDQLVAWASDRFVNLEQQTLDEKQAAQLQNQELGTSVAERQERLLRVKKVSRWMSRIGLLIAVSVMVFPYFYEMQLITCMLVPLVALVYMRMQKGIMTMGDVRPGKTASPNFFVLLPMPGLSLMIRAFNDYDVVDYSRVWPLVAGFALVPILLVMDRRLWPYTWRQEGLYNGLTVMLLLVIPWSLGTVCGLNVCLGIKHYDDYQTRVVDKRENSSSKGGMNYSFYVTPYGPEPDSTFLHVSSEEYQAVEEGDTIDVFIATGAFGIPVASVDLE